MNGTLLLILAFGASTAAGSDGEATVAELPSDSTHGSPHTEHSTWLLGAKAVQLSLFPASGDTFFGAGAGIFAERTVIPGWLEAEVSVSVVRVAEEDAWVIPIDLLLKKPFELGAFCPYGAIGPTLSVVNRAEQGTRAFLGVAVVAGFYLWFGRAIGLDVEIDYAVVAENGVQHELTVAGGPTLRF